MLRDSDSEALLMLWGESETAAGGTEPAYGVRARLTASCPSCTPLISVSASIQTGGNLQHTTSSVRWLGTQDCCLQMTLASVKTRERFMCLTSKGCSSVMFDSLGGGPREDGVHIAA